VRLFFNQQGNYYKQCLNFSASPFEILFFVTQNGVHVFHRFTPKSADSLYHPIVLCGAVEKIAFTLIRSTGGEMVRRGKSSCLALVLAELIGRDARTNTFFGTLCVVLVHRQPRHATARTDGCEHQLRVSWSNTMRENSGLVLHSAHTSSFVLYQDLC
jgi:hypothetical protein